MIGPTWTAGHNLWRLHDAEGHCTAVLAVRSCSGCRQVANVQSGCQLAPGWVEPQTVQRAQQTFEPAETSVALARAFVRVTLDQWYIASDEAELVVSELATNVLRHARCRFDVCVERIGDALLIEVSDLSDARPNLSHPAPNDTSGRGLFIVERVSRAWGSKADRRGGKRVWAELALDGVE